jgi:hypothetical protein
MSFLKKLWEGIKKIFMGLRSKSKAWVTIAIQVVEGIKTVMATPVADVITSIIPGSADDKVKEVIRLWVPKVLLQLHMVEAIIDIKDPNEQLNAILAKIKLSDKETRNIIWHGLGSLIIEKLSDGKFSWQDSVAVAQYYYDHILDTDDEPTPEETAAALASDDED